MKPEIHPSAVVDASVELEEGVRVGPFCVLRGPSRIGAGTLLMERVSIGPYVTMGARNRIHMGAIIGHEPQDHSFSGGVSETVIGDENEIREYVTIHRGTKEHSRTWIGSGTLLMAGSHVAHNCQVGDRAILANGVLLAGHVSVGAGAFLSGGVLAHQFIRIGRLALLRGGIPHEPRRSPLCHHGRNPHPSDDQPGGAEAGGILQGGDCENRVLLPEIPSLRNARPGGPRLF